MITKNEMTTMSINDLAHLIDATDEVIRKKQNELSTVPELDEYGKEHPLYADVKLKLNKLCAIRTQIVDTMEEILLGTRNV